MTREEAIKAIQDFIGWFKEDSLIRKALEMAIQALSQKPKYRMAYDYADGTVHKFAWIDGGWKEIAVEPYCDDAISRDMALEKMADYVASGYADSVEDFEEYSRIICQLPSVTQKSGKWILLDECTNSGYYCSNCQKKLVKEGWSQTVKKIKYCPNCGAKMESEE